MKKVFALLSCIGFAFSLQAQITVTNASFPEAGDTLRTITDLTPEGVEITSAGGPFTWDFSELGLSLQQEVVYRPASEGMAAASFPDATLFTSTGDSIGETYYLSTATAFSNLGFSGTEPIPGIPIPSEYRFSPPLVERNAPLNFIDLHTPTSTLSIAFSLAEIPDEILDSLGIPGGLVDSVRVRISTSRNDLVDAYGMLTIPGGTYDVLRERRITYLDTRLDIHSIILGWTDVTDLLGEFGDFGRDTTTNYLFISNTEKEIIADVLMAPGDTTVQQVTFKDNGVLNSAKDVVTADKPAIEVYPNPAFDETFFSMKNMAPGTYTLRLFTKIGMPVMAEKISYEGGSIFVGSLPAGLYIYDVTNSDGAILTGGKLVVVRN